MKRKESILTNYYNDKLTKAQQGYSFLPEQDPEMMYTDRFNTELNKEEQKEFDDWIAKESKRRGRNIIMDKGAYDVQGFWKSGDYNRMKDGHGFDTWKKPNHPTFSNQSIYHGTDGFYGGNWTPESGYQPSKQSADVYGPSYYNRMFAEEPGRSEHLDASRYMSGINRPSPLYYKQGGQSNKYFYNKGYGVPKFQFAGQSFEQLTGMKPITSLNNVTDVIGRTPIQIIQDNQKGQEIANRNIATNKRQFINQGQASTPYSEARRKTLTQQAVAGLPNVTYNKQTGTTSAINPNMTYEGNPSNFMGERQQKTVDHIGGALEAAGYLTGAGELAGAGYKVLRNALAKSMESGLLSKTYKVNPWALKENPDMFLYRARPVGQNIDMNMAAKFKAKQAAGVPLKWYEQRTINIVDGLAENQGKILEREKYFGRFFEKDPNRLDWYMNPETRNFADNDAIEILRTRLPKTEAAKLNVSQFPDSKVLSASPETEFILPKDMVQSSTRFPESSWQQLIQEDKTFNTPNWLRGFSKPKSKVSNSIMRNAEGKIQFLDDNAYRDALVTGKKNVINYLSDPRYASVVEQNQQLANRLGLNQRLPIQREMAMPSLYEARLAKINEPLTLNDPRVLETDIINNNSNVGAQYARTLDGKGSLTIPRVHSPSEITRNTSHEVLHHIYPNLGEGYPSFTPLEARKAKSVFKDNAALRKIEEQNNVPFWYLDDVDELVPNSFDLASDLGISKFQKYPGMESFKNLLGSYTGDKKFIRDALKLDNKRDYKRAWDMLSGVRLGVIPAVAGAAALQQQKQGGMITDPMGQWKYPGMNTRIPGSNITMQGVPYPVLAKANNGMTKMMYPGQDYSFPGASHVDEYPMMQEGGAPCTDSKGNIIPCEEKRLRELGSDAYTAMQPFYETLYEAGNKYANPETGVTSPLNSLRATMKGLIKHPDVMFMKRHQLPSELISMDPKINPYHVQGYNTPLQTGTQPWQPTQWAEPRKERNTGEGWQNFKIRLRENAEERRGRRNRGSTGCWGANCYDENETQDQAKYGGGLDQYQTKGEVTYTHSPGQRGAYRLQRTVSPYTRNRDIKRFIEAPTDPRQVNFLQNYAGAMSGYQDDPGFVYPTQVPIEGEKHWNVDRFIIDPQFSNRNITNNESLEQNRANVLSDMYKYYMLQDPEHKGKAFRKAKRFVRREIDPRIKGPFLQSYNTVGTENPDYFQQGYQGTENFADQNALKDLYFREALGSGNVTPEEIEKLKDVSMDYFRNYKKMSRRESKDQWKKWNQETTTAKETNIYSLGGGLLSRTVTCSNCGHSWKGVTGGLDPMTCHKCGGMIKMQNGGLTKYQSLGEVNEQPKQDPEMMYTDRVKFPSIVIDEPNRGDSIFVLNNNKIIKNLLDSGKYNWMQDSKTKKSTKKNVNPKEWGKKFNRLKEFYESVIPNEVILQAKKKGKLNDYRKQKGKFIGTSDWAVGGGDDYGFPFQYIHPDIAPQYEGDLQPKELINNPFVYSFGYDELAITPWDMLTPKQQKERLEKYGVKGTPYADPNYSSEPKLKSRPFVPATKLPMGEPSMGMQIQQRTFPKLNIPNVNMSGPYMVGYHDYNTNEGIDKGFQTAEERDAFMQTLREREGGFGRGMGDISSYYNVSKRNKKQYGGDISIPQLPKNNTPLLQFYYSRGGSKK